MLPMMLKEITSETLFPILKLAVAENQKGVCSSQCLFDYQKPTLPMKLGFRGIYDGDTPVGFVMLYLDQKKPEYWVWRFMIDHRFQGKGFGKLSMLEVIDYVKTLPNAQELCLSYVPGEGSPSKFYESLGFVDTGKFDESGKEIIMKYTF